MPTRTEAILMTLFAVANKAKKAYCYPSQDKILSLIGQYHGFKISLRTLNRDLQKLEKDGLIKRVRRISKRDLSLGQFKTTLYKFDRKAFKSPRGLKKWLKAVGTLSRVTKMANHPLTKRR